IERIGGKMKRSEHVERSAFYRGLVLLAYYTGLRLADVLSLRWSDFSSDGLEAISKLHGEGRALVFGDLIGRRNLMEVFRRIVRTAGLQGSFKWLRRS